MAKSAMSGRTVKAAVSHLKGQHQPKNTKPAPTTRVKKGK